MTTDDTPAGVGGQVDPSVATRRLAAALQPLLRNIPLSDKLNQFIDAALGSVPGVDHYAVCLVDGDRVEIRGGGDDVVARLHAVQHELRDGPCWETTRGGRAAAVYEDIAAVAAAHRPRNYREAAGQTGVRAHVAVAIRPRKRVLGSIDVLSDSRTRVPVDLGTLTVLSQLAALAIEEAKLRDGIEAGLRGRTVIGAAAGIVMERFGLDEDVALGYLKRHSSASNRKLRDLAAEIVETRHLPE